MTSRWAAYIRLDLNLPMALYQESLQSEVNTITVAFEVSHLKLGCYMLTFLKSGATYSVRQANNYPYSVHGGGNYFPANRNFIRKCQSGVVNAYSLFFEKVF